MTALLFFERSLICLTFFLLLAVIGLILVILAPNRFRKIDIFFDSVIFVLAYGIYYLTSPTIARRDRFALLVALLAPLLVISGGILLCLVLSE